ncbi:MAG TPA: antirestriction protein ArdA, partial [Solirubrobacteraceae bacterium]|nr:antirestriction protein ArdA [Solirubrobacteraceae bacterium]
PMSTNPRVYVACLAAYNNGRLHGAWIDADQSAAASPELGAEEWAIHDYEGFGELRLSEWESFERVSAIAAGIAEHGEAFSAWLAYDTSRDATDMQAFEDAYRGEWDSLRDYAENFADDIGLYDAADKAGSHYVVVDLDMLTRDLDIELYTAESDHHTVYVFDPAA